MYKLNSSPIKEVSLGENLKLTLDNYYDLLKTQVGGLKSDEYLQLKLVADTIDLSEDPAPEGYKWFSYYNLLKRSDLAVTPTPTIGEVQTSSELLTEVYGDFLRKLRSFVVQKELSDEDQKEIANLEKVLDNLKREARELRQLDFNNWRNEAELMGYELGDTTAYVQWSNMYGHLRSIEFKHREIRSAEFKKRTILDKEYSDQDDREIIDAEFVYTNPSMRLRYPIFADSEYNNGSSFNLSYLANLPLGSTALFDDRLVVGWDKTLGTIKSTGAGGFEANMDSSSQESSSITTDWKGSASAKYGFFKVKANASEFTKVSEDFLKSQSVKLNAEAAFKVKIEFPQWFRASLFQNKHVKENPYDFEEFFGENGRLLYYPSELIIVRGFGVTFESSENWSYDYNRRFSASGGGGLNVLGISFGGSASYSKNVKEHKVDKRDRLLSIKDDETTLRFVGYAVKKVTIFEESVAENMMKASEKNAES